MGPRSIGDDLQIDDVGDISPGDGECSRADAQHWQQLGASGRWCEEHLPEKPYTDGEATAVELDKDGYRIVHGRSVYPGAAKRGQGGSFIIDEHGIRRRVRRLVSLDAVIIDERHEIR
jgi:hypothetical protein